MAAEARSAPRVVRDRETAFSVHPRLSGERATEAIDQVILRIDRIRAAYLSAEDLLAENTSKPTEGDISRAWMLVMLGNEDLVSVMDTLEVLGRDVSAEVSA